MEEILQVFTRLNYLIEQYDQTETNIANVEMQNEGLYRLSSSYEKDASEAKTSANKALKAFVAQRDAYERAIEDITGMSPGELRDKLQDIRLSIERAGEYTLEEKKLRGVFEILVSANAFTDSPGESRADFEDKLSSVKRIAELAIQQMEKLVDSSINKKTIVGATDSVLSQLRDRSIGEKNVILTR